MAPIRLAMQYFPGASGPVKTKPLSYLVGGWVAQSEALAGALELGDDLIYRSAVPAVRICASVGCGPVEVPQSIKRHTPKGAGAVDAIGAEAVQNGLGPVTITPGRQLVHYTNPIRPAVGCRAVKVASRVENHSGVGRESVSTVRVEAMEHLLRPPAHGGCKFEHRPLVVGAAKCGGAVKIAGGVNDQVGFGRRPVRAIDNDVVNNRLRPPCGRRTQLEHGSSPASTAGRCGAVQVSGGVEGHAGNWIDPIEDTGIETMQNLLCPNSVRRGR